MMSQARAAVPSRATGAPSSSFASTSASAPSPSGEKETREDPKDDAGETVKISAPKATLVAGGAAEGEARDAEAEEGLLNLGAAFGIVQREVTAVETLRRKVVFEDSGEFVALGVEATDDRVRKLLLRRA